MIKRQRPVIASDWIIIGPNPDMKNIGIPFQERQEAVDHHVFCGPDKKWHLWSCLRNCSGMNRRILYHWEGESLQQEQWTCTDEILLGDTQYGECLGGAEGTQDTQIQSPFVVEQDGTWYMLYGGLTVSAEDSEQTGDALLATRGTCQMCLMTSPDGRSWTRHLNDKGQSRIFTGPGNVRDPSLIKIDGLWYCYYAGYHDGDPLNCGIYLRTSQDLMNWSDWEIVNYDEHFHHHAYMAESPTVIEHEGLYYLFRTENYQSARSHVYCSDDPRNFGIDDGRKVDMNEYYVGRIPVAAPELITDHNGDLYVSSNHDLSGGVRLARIAWVDCK